MYQRLYQDNVNYLLPSNPSGEENREIAEISEVLGLRQYYKSCNEDKIKEDTNMKGQFHSVIWEIITECFLYARHFAMC